MASKNQYQGNQNNLNQVHNHQMKPMQISDPNTSKVKQESYGYTVCSKAVPFLVALVIAILCGTILGKSGDLEEGKGEQINLAYISGFIAAALAFSIFILNCIMDK